MTLPVGRTSLDDCRASCHALMSGDYAAALAHIQSAKRRGIDDPCSARQAELQAYVEAATTYILRHADLIDSRPLKEAIVGVLATG